MRLKQFRRKRKARRKKRGKSAKQKKWMTRFKMASKACAGKPKREFRRCVSAKMRGK